MIKIVHFELTFLSIDLYIYFAYFGTKTISSHFTRCWDQNKTAESKPLRCVDKLATEAYLEGGSVGGGRGALAPQTHSQGSLENSCRCRNIWVSEKLLNETLLNCFIL